MYQSKRLRVVRPEELKCTVGKHNTETKSSAFWILFEDLDIGIGFLPLYEKGTIQTRRTRANHDNSHIPSVTVPLPTII